MAVDEKGTQQPVRAAVGDLLAEMAPVAARLGCEAELARVDRILTEGASYQRQRAVVSEGAVGRDALRPVVDQLVGELASDQPGVLLSSS